MYMYVHVMYTVCTHSLVMVVEDGPLSVHVREAQVSQLQIVCDGLQTHLRTELDRMREGGIRGGKIFTHISIWHNYTKSRLS